MAAILSSFSIFLPLFVSLFIQLLVHSEAGGGFTVDLIHRDSPQSPFYNPSLSESDRLTNAFRRSFSRAANFRKHQPSAALNNIQSEIIPTSGEYLMNLSIGTPRFDTLAIADTGSDFIWTQCQPCSDCFKQNSPLFDPKKSSTYRALSCQSQPCETLRSPSCTDNNTCQYRITYGDQSYSVGSLASETFTFGSSSGQSLSSTRMVFGCGFKNQGTFNETASGIIGLGGGSLSLVSQLRDTIDGRFSYCLVTDPKQSSKINFGANAVVSGSGVVTTPIVKKDIDTFYFLTLESIVVGNDMSSAVYETKIPFERKSTYDGEVGNIIIDSGTTLTLLSSEMYHSLESDLKEAIDGETIQDPKGNFSLCYSANNVVVPTLTFRFTVADLELPPSSTFIQNGDLICLAMVPNDELAIFGNLSQMNFLIGYDLVKNEISFMPTDCSKH